MPGPMHPGAGAVYATDGDWYELRAPTDFPTYDPAVDTKVIDWRMDAFVARGFGLLKARCLAVRRDIDRAQVERMLDQGATHAQVLEALL